MSLALGGLLRRLAARPHRLTGWPTLHRASLSSSPASPDTVSDTEPQNLSSNAQQRHRLQLFNAELDRQQKRANRSVEKIEVSFTGVDGQKHSLFMNKGVSTPLDTAKHLSEELSSESVLALVNNVVWDMHRPLTASCSIAFLNFKTPSSKEEADAIKLCNNALWRSGSLILGSVFETAFNETYNVKPISFPIPYIKSGSFIYDFQVTRRGQPLAWEPSAPELRALSLAAERLLASDLPFQPLDVPGPLALELFRHNDYKSAAVRSVLAARPVESQTVTVYRVGDFVDLSSGPMISRTGLVGRFAFAAVHPISTPDYGQLLRVQGFAVPRAFLTHFSAMDVLQRRAAVLNRAFLPTRPGAPRAAVPATPAAGGGAGAALGSE